MLSELEKLSKEELLLIANKYHLYNAQNMNKEELIKNILIVSGEDDTPKKESQDIKIKNTSGTKLYIWFFNLIILLLVIMTFAQYFTRFYFNGKLFTNVNINFYSLFLSFLSILWSGYVYYYWWKYKVLNLFFLINILLSFGYFGYFMLEYWKGVSAGNSSHFGNVNPWFNLYKTLFYVWLGLSVTISASILTIFIIKQIKY